MYSENNSSSVMIATPMYNGQCYFGYVSSLMSNVIDLRVNNVGAYWMFIPNESLITRGRNYAVNHFLKYSKCTHLMFIDADIIFPEGSIRRLLHAQEDVICAPYPKKFIDWENINNIVKNNKDKDLPDLSKFGASYVINYLDNNNPPIPNYKGVVEVAHAGTGFMLIRREVFEVLEPNMSKARAANFGRFNEWYTEYFKTDIGAEGVFLSEDWYFCEQYRKLGGKIHLIPDIKLDHIGMHIYTGDIEAAGANVS